MDGQTNAMSPHKQNVTFFARDVPNPVKSEAVGYPVFEAADYVRIETPGEKEGIPIFPATQEYKNRFPTEWENYRLKRAPTPTGMPLAILFPQYPERVAALEFANVRTVEQLAELSDTAKQNIGLGADEWQKKAIEFLKTAAKTHDYHALKKSQEMLEATIAKQEAQIVAMQMKLNEYEARMRTDPSMGVLGPTPFAAPPVAQPPSDLLAQMAAQIAALAAKVEKAADPAPVKRRGRPPIRKSQTSTEEAT